MLTMSMSVARELDDLHRLLEADEDRPRTVASPSSCTMRVEIEAEWKAGMTRTLRAREAAEGVERHQFG